VEGDCWIRCGIPLLRQRWMLRQQWWTAWWISVDALVLAGVSEAGSATAEAVPQPPGLRSRPVVAIFESDPLLNLEPITTPAGDPAPTAGFSSPTCC